MKEIEKIEKKQENEDANDEVDDSTEKVNERKRKKREVDTSENQKKKRKKDDFKVKYIGETKKSGYERGKDHMRQLKSLDERSHLLKHLVEKHSVDNR